MLLRRQASALQPLAGGRRLRPLPSQHALNGTVPV